jgi:multidrug efflux system membrane fusion protein
MTTDPGATVVPTGAVQAGQEGKPYVYVVKPDRSVDLRPVVVARTVGNETIVKSGVNPGETVVTDGQLRLVPGAKVVNRSEAAAASAAAGRGQRGTKGEGGAKGEGGTKDEGGTKGGARGEGGAKGDAAKTPKGAS